jgi:murein DD-endopeptidase MepM/ murein hydrolase activator NlpD
VHAVNDVADNAAFGSNRPYGLGNHVVIRKDDEYVILGHMRHGTVAVKPGDQVQAGQAIGRVGNSGWTERPHLHIQAMRAADGDWWHGEPLALRFGGHFLVRNQLVRS